MALASDQAGRTAEARSYYERVANAWHRADPVLQPRAERARLRAAALR